MKMSRLFQILAAIVALSLPIALSAAPVVVLSSTVAGLAPGSIIDGADPVDIPAGGVVMINDSTGATRTLVGPYSGPIGESGGDETASRNSVASGLSRLIASREEEQAKLGAVRAAPAQIVDRADLLTVANSADQCILPGVTARLWRPGTMDADSRLTIEAVESGQTAATTWRRGETVIDWPADLGLRDGERYRIRLDVAPRTVELALRIAPAGLSDPAAQAAWLFEAGCRRQALQALAALSQ